MYFVYVLRNKRTKSAYVGHTSDLERRITQHNTSDFNPNRYTSRIRGPWELIHKQEYVSRAEAMKREKFLKSGQGRA